jgi:bifunctional non-homologous end joining protein LigD
MGWLKPMLAKSTKDRPDAAGSPEFVAEPKLDGQRVEVEIVDGRTKRAYSRTGKDVLAERAHQWLKDVKWPVMLALLDGELYAGNGVSAGQATAAEAVSTAGVPTSLAIFDLLELGLRSYVKSSPWEERRAHLEDAFRQWQHERVALVPYSSDAQALWDLWVGQYRGEGIMLKNRQGKWWPGKRTDDWIKWKQELDVDVVITGIAEEATYTKGGYRTGEAALTYGYADGSGGFKTVGQGVKVGSRAELEAYIGRVATMKCAGVMESGALRHHRLVRFRDDKPANECFAA